MVAKYVFLFPGQGAQAPGMMKDICEISQAARDCLDRISQAAGESMETLLWDTDAEQLSRSDRSQLAITAGSLVTLAALKERGIEPAAAAGFSLGEFPALYAAGVLSFEDLIRVVKRRGEIMQAVCDSITASSAGRAPGMAAVVGLESDTVLDIAARTEGAYAANMNSPRQTVLSGTAEGLDAAEALCKEAGARRCVRLSVAGPFHSPLMEEAARSFKDAIADVQFNDAKLPLFSNVSGKMLSSGAEAKEAAVRHLVQPVLWTSEEAALGEYMKSEGGNWRVLEVGPGKVLSGLWKDGQAADIAAATPCGTAEAIAQAASEGGV